MTDRLVRISAASSIGDIAAARWRPFRRHRGFRGLLSRSNPPPERAAAQAREADNAQPQDRQ